VTLPLHLLAADSTYEFGGRFWLYAAFLTVVAVCIGLDLGVLRRRDTVQTVRQAIGWTAVWFGVAMVFNVAIYFLYEHHLLGIGLGVPQFSGTARDVAGAEAARLFFTGYVVEQSLSADNVFVIAIVFSGLRIPLDKQHRVLYWGILGAVVLRGLMIGLGVAFVQSVSWAIYVFGGLLVVTALKMLFTKEDGSHTDEPPTEKFLLRTTRRFMKVSPTLDGNRFFTVVNGHRMATPMLLALVVVEFTDVIFAVDSIPAIFGITLDPFLIFTSNVSAILGLRSLYFCVAGMMAAFRYLKVSLVLILLFVGVKMLVHSWVAIPSHWSLVIILCILGTGIVASLLSKPAPKPLTGPNL